MDIEHQEQHGDAPRSVLFRVTPLSKYLAMTLFIAMPFVGGWIGYMHAPAVTPEGASHSANELSGTVTQKISEPAPNTYDVWTASNAHSQVVRIFETESVALDVGDYTEGVLRFDISAQRPINDSSLYIDSLRFDAVNGFVTLSNGNEEERLLRLYRFKGTDLETAIEDATVSNEVTEVDYDDYIRNGLKDSPLLSSLEPTPFRSFCSLVVNDDPNDITRKWAVLDYDREKFGVVFDETIQENPCGITTFTVFRDLIVENFGFPMDATTPKVGVQSISVDRNTSYTNTVTGKKTFKYPFLNEAE